jgi:FtsP/CotA-like multicopper oxidase with cupredoxin domain
LTIRSLVIRSRFLLAILALSLFQLCAFGQNAPCPRYQPGSAIVEPKNLFSAGGKLQVNFTYQTRVDQFGNTLYCFTTDDGVESPTLHVHPGDELIINLKNALPLSSTPAAMTAMPGMAVTGWHPGNCTAKQMDTSSVNIHYHGTNTPPVCHQDEVITTVVNSGDSYGYDVHFPADEPPGLYWYHPHIHGMSEAAVQGGASGALIVEGIQNSNPEVAGLPQQTLIIRDNLVPGNPTPGGDVPSWDISVNYIPVPYPSFTPVVVPMKPLEKQFWRVLNASADTIIDLQLQYDHVTQPLTVVALDGVPTGSQDGLRLGEAVVTKDILLPPASRAEFIVTGPSLKVKSAVLSTLNIDTGPDGDNDPLRPILAIKASTGAAEPPLRIANTSSLPPSERFFGLADVMPTAHRKLYFSEVLTDPSDPNSPTNFYITVDGQTPVLFDPSNPPAIITRQGEVEDWTIENRAQENHEFHIHQIHFLLLEQNGRSVDNGQYLDTVQVPYWSGTGPYPSVKVRMDFRGPVVGDFVYHCHILGHEDGGMMAIIRVLPAK